MAQVDEVMIHHQKDVFESQEEYDEYMLNTPLEARFDPSTIQFIVTEAHQKHEAYGMLFSEYHQKRSRLQHHDESEKKRLSFRIPSYFAHIVTDIALKQKVSLHRALVLLVELGLIHFQVDYHDEYQAIRTWRLDSFDKLNDSESLRKYKRIERHAIVLESGGRACPHFVPSVPEWLYNAVMDTKAYLNMSSSDMVFFCLCYGCINCFNDTDLPQIVKEDMRKVCGEFQYEIQEYQRQISNV